MNAILEQINTIGKSFVEFALPMLAQFSILFLILLLIDFLLRRKVRSVFRYWIWMLVLAKLVLPTSLSSPLSLGYLFGDRLTSLQVAPIAPQPKEQAPVISPQTIDFSNVPPAVDTPPVVTSPKTLPSPTQPASLPSPPPTTLSWQGVVFLLWLAVVIAMGLLLLQRAIFVKGLVAQAVEADDSIKDTFNSCLERIEVRRRIGLKVSTNATSPAVCGLFRPVILLPNNLSTSLSANQLQAVLLHELTHIKRGDLWVNLAQTILQIVYFYNPLLWIANAIIRRIREQAVDETVLVAMGQDAKQYPQTLVSVAKLAFRRPVLSLRLIGVVESKSALASRIKRILTRPIPKSAKLGIVGLIVVIIAAAVLIPMAKREKVIIGEGPEREMTLTLGWSGEKVKIPAPVVLPEWGRKTKEFELWKLGIVRREITVFDIDDYKYVAQGHGRKKNVKGELNIVLYSVERYRPNRTLEAYTLYSEADGAPTEWRTYNEDGNKRIWVVNLPTAGDCKRKVIFYGPDGKETKKWQVSEFDVVYAELVTDPNGQSYFTHYLKELIHSSYPKQFAATLPNGVTVELVGVCEYPSAGKPWWRPDGRIADGDDFQIYNQDVKPMKWPDLPDRQFKYAYLFKVSPSDNSTVDTDVSVGDRWHTSYTSDKSVRIGYGYSNSGNVNNFPFEGGIKVAVAAGNHQQFESKVYDGAVNDMSILSDRTTNVTISGPRDDPAYSEKLIDVTLTSNEYDVAVVYELTDGTAKDARPESRMGGPHITSFFGKQNPLIRHSFRVSDPWEQIKKFVVKYRKYQLVTFKNVSLRPGIKTDVQVEGATQVAGRGEQEQEADSIRTVPAITKTGKSIIQIDLMTGEVVSGRQMDWETAVELKNILGDKVALDDPAPPSKKSTLAAGALLRKAVAATDVVEGASGRNKRVTKEELKAVVDTLASRGYLKILTNPTLQVVSGKTAKVKSAKASSTSTTEDSFEVTARVLDDGYIELQTRVVLDEKSTPADQDSLLLVTKRELSGTFRIGSGASCIAGGIEKTVKRPVVGDNPETLEYRTTEELVVLTATVIDAPSSPQTRADVQVEVEEHDGKSRNVDILGPALQVLDKKTGKPIPNCSFTFNGWGRVEKTDMRGIYNDPNYNFAVELVSGARELDLWHPDYDNKLIGDYKADKFGVVTVLLDKGGNASLEVRVSLKVRGKETDAACKVRLLNMDKEEIRRIESSDDSTYRFSGLAEGEYIIEAYFWSSYPTHNEKIYLSDGEHKKVSINAQTDQVARIRLAGRVIDKQTNKGIKGVTIHFVGATDDDARTYEDGSFSTVADRARFHQCLLMLENDEVQKIQLKNHVNIEIVNNISEDFARNLNIHIDPDYTKLHPNVKLRDEDGDGIFCDKVHCVICSQVLKTDVQIGIAKPTAQEPNQTRGRIRGVVVNSVTGQPIKGAYVGVGDFGDSGGSNYERHRAQGFFAKAETDPNGRFELDGLAYSDDHPEYDLHPLVVTHPDFVRHDEKIKLIKGEPAPDVKVSMKPAAKINVTVVDSNNNPLQGPWLFRLESLDGRRFITPGEDPHLSAFASSVWIEMPKPVPAKKTLSGITGFSFTGLTGGEYSIDVMQFAIIDNYSPPPSGMVRLPLDTCNITYYGGITKLNVEAAETKEVQIKPADYQTSAIIKMPEDPVKKPEIPPFVVISRNVGLLAWDDGKAHGPEDERLGRLEKNALYYNTVIDGNVLKIKNLPPGSYIVFAGPIYFMSATKMEVLGGREVTVDVPAVKVSEHAKVGLWTFNRKVKPEARDYSVSELCQLINAKTDSNPRLVPDPSIENQKIKLTEKEMSIWDVLEMIYLDKGWKVKEGEEKTLILQP